MPYDTTGSDADTHSFDSKPFFAHVSILENHYVIVIIMMLFVFQSIYRCAITMPFRFVSFSVAILFSRVHATLEPALSIRPSVGPSNFTF